MELNSILFQSSKSKVSLEALLNGKLAYLPKLNAISEDTQIPRSPRSLRPSDIIIRYHNTSALRATKSILFDSENEQPSKPSKATVFERPNITIPLLFPRPRHIPEYISSTTSLSLISTDETQSVADISNPITPRDRTGGTTSRCTCSSQRYIPCQTCGAVTSTNNNPSLFGGGLLQSCRTIERKLSNNQQTAQSEKSSPARLRYRNTISSPFHPRITQEPSSGSLSSRELTTPAGFSEEQLNDPQFLGFDINLFTPIGFVPVFYLETPQSKNILIYFHGNGDDIFSSYPLLAHLRQTLEVNVMAVEYPGYGNYKSNTTCNAEIIFEDADYVYEYITQHLKFNRKNIIVMGRSLGTGPATYLASKHRIGALALISGFTSIRGVVSDFAGFFKYIVKERFNNLDRIEKVVSPTFLLHGKKDSLISFKQSLTLKDHCKSPCEIIIPPEMDHQSFDYTQDLSTPFKNFLRNQGFPLKAQGDVSRLPEAITYHPSQNAAYSMY